MNWLLRPDRLWMFGALAGAVALSALAWFVLIGPQRDDTVNVEEETTQAEAQIIVEQRKLTRLKAEYADSDRYAAELAANRQALPSVAATGALLRELQTAGEQARVDVPSITTSQPTEIKNIPGVASVTISVSAEGQLERLQFFLVQVQRIQPRAMLISNVVYATRSEPAAITIKDAVLTISAQIFVALQQTDGTATAPTTSASTPTAD